MKLTDPTIASLIAAGEALRKAAEGAESDLYAIGWNDGMEAASSKAQFGCSDAVAILLRHRVIRTVAAWNKAAKAARKARGK